MVTGGEENQPQPMRKALFISSIVVFVIVLAGSVLSVLASMGGTIAHIIFFNQVFSQDLTYQGFFFSFGGILYDACLITTVISAIISSIILIVFTAKQLSDAYRTLIVSFCFIAIGFGFYWVAFFYSLTETIAFARVNGYAIPFIGSTTVALLILLICFILNIVVAGCYAKFELVPEPSLVTSHENTLRIMTIGCGAATGITIGITLLGTLVYVIGFIVILALNSYTDATTQIICYVLYLLSIPFLSILSPILITVGSVVKQIPNKHGTNMRHSAFILDMYSMSSCLSLCIFLGNRMNFIAPQNAGYIVAFCGLLIMLIAQGLNLIMGIVVEMTEFFLRKKYGPQGIPKVEHETKTTIQVKVADSNPQSVSSHEKLASIPSSKQEQQPQDGTRMVIGLAKVLYDYIENENPDQYMSVKEGDMLDVLQKFEDGWFLCRKGDREGLVPSNYLKEL